MKKFYILYAVLLFTACKKHVSSKPAVAGSSGSSTQTCPLAPTATNQLKDRYIVALKGSLAEPRIDGKVLPAVIGSVFSGTIRRFHHQAYTG